MSIDSGPEGSTSKNRRTATRPDGADISEALQVQIADAARRIRRAHRAELADARKADRAAQLFRSIILGKRKPAAAPAEETPGHSGQSMELLAGEIGGLLSDVVRAGAELLSVPLTALAQAGSAAMGTPTKPAAPPAERRTRKRKLEPQHTPSNGAGELPDSNGEDDPKLRGMFRQFLPMLVSSLSQGGDGSGIAETVISLFGRPVYDDVSGLGKRRIMQIIKSEPDLLAQVAPIESQFGKFLDEFVSYGNPVSEQARASDGLTAPASVPDGRADS